MTKPVDPLRLSVILFEGFELLDVFGPVELLSKSPHCRITWCGPEVGPVASSQGVGVVSEVAYDGVVGAETDMLLVPGARARGRCRETLISSGGWPTWVPRAR